VHVTIEHDRLAVAGLPVERLIAADLAGCLALADDRGWPPEPEKWQLLFEVGEVFGIRDPAGGLAAAVALTRYGPGLAAIGMMLVAERHGRRGVGRALLTHVLGQAGDTVTCLFATGFGRPLYERLGFRPAWMSARYIGPLAPGSADGDRVPVRPATAADLDGIAALDRQAFGADRSVILGRLPQRSERFLVAPGPAPGPARPAAGEGALISGPAGRSDPAGRAIRGFAASVIQNGTLMPGPVVADDLDVATALISGLAEGSGLPVRIEVASTHPGLARWAAGHGLTERSQTTVMTRGGALPGRPGQVFGPLNVAMG
jgi:ribosomal protein S18 acetylase RimI-like enzyme